MPNYTALYPRRLQSSQSLLREPQIPRSDCTRFTGVLLLTSCGPALITASKHTVKYSWVCWGNVQEEMKPYVAGNLHLWTKLYATFISNVVFEDFGWKQQQYLLVFFTKSLPFYSCVLCCLSSLLVWLKASYCREGGHYSCTSVKRVSVLVTDYVAWFVLVFRSEHTNERNINYDDLRIVYYASHAITVAE